MERIGLHIDDVVDKSVIEIWEENWLPFQIFMRLRSQWRVGMSGCTGMDYSLLPMLLDAFNVKKKKHPEILDALQTLEFEALSVMNAKD